MRYYTQQHRYYCGIDLHSKWMYLCIIDFEGVIRFHKNIPTNPEAFMSAMAPYREDVVVGVESLYCWYWLSDLCAKEGIKFILGHALYMKVIHGAKSKNDRIDSEKLARMLRGGNFPLAYVYPAAMRSTRDLMRRRLFFVRKRAELISHIQMTHHQYNVPEPGSKIARHNQRKAFEPHFEDEVVTRMIESDLCLCEHYTNEINRLQHYLSMQVKKSSARNMEVALLKTIPGIGDILSLTLAYEINDVSRFPTVQQFSSYARLIKPEKRSAGKKAGGGGKKIGNPHLRWAFSEAGNLMLRADERAKKLLERLQRRGSKARALGVLNHKIGKAVYFMLLRQEGFNQERFFSN